MHRVIFACVHNAGRSQMAAAFFRELADPALATSISAGTEPAERVHPVVAEAMAELARSVRESSGGLPAVRAIRDEVRRRVIALVDERGWARRPMPRRYIPASDDAFPATWRITDGRAGRRVTLPDFASALRLAVAIGAEAEALAHHPDVAFGWGYLEISCTTHDAGGLTDADVALAHAVERVLPGG